ncbi:MAG: ABC transporter permease [Myxococcaceae bacterium]
MTTAMAIAKREFRTFFNSPVAYIVLGVYLLIAGWFFFAPLFLAGEASMRGFFAFSPLLWMFFAPAVTMRSIAEERKAGTLELLLTMPLKDWEVVAGKFMASLAMVAVGLLCTLPFAFTVAGLTAPGTSFDWGPVAAGYLGLLLLASSFLALGLWASAMSRNQIVGFIVGLLFCFAFFIVDKFAILLPESLGQLLEYVSVSFHFENIARGVLDTRDLLFYGSLTAAGLVLTTRSLAASRG